MEGTQNQLYQDNMFYDVSVVDLLSPEATSFVVGVNGKISTYPTHKAIRVPGRELKVLMDATIPMEQFTMENGFRKITGCSLRSRFAISIRSFGAFPTEKATVLQPFGSKAVHLDAAHSLAQSPELPSPEDFIPASEPKPDETGKTVSLPEIMESRREELESESKEVLEAHAESMGMKVSKLSKAALVDAILATERACITAEM